MPTPATDDSGDLGALGLLLQASGGFLLGLNLFALVWLYTWPEVEPLLLLAAGTGALRSALHLLAGRALALRQPTALRFVWAYVLFATLQTGALVPLTGQWLAELPRLEGLAGPVASVAIPLLAWPLVLAAHALRPSVRARFARAQDPRFTHALLLPDRGLGDLGLLMLGLSAIGLLMCVGSMVSLFYLDSGAAIAIVGLVLLLLAGRSYLHLRAGRAALWTADPTETHRLVRLYFLVALATTALLAAPPLIFAGGPDRLLALAGVLPLAGFLLVWPWAAHSAAARLHDALDPDDPFGEGYVPFAPSASPGERALGFAITGHAALIVSFYLFERLGLRPALQSDVAGPTGWEIASEDIVAWWGLAASICGLWAGTELAIGGRRKRVAAFGYAILGCFSALIPLIAQGLPFAHMNPGAAAGRLAGHGAELALPLLAAWSALGRPGLPDPDAPPGHDQS